MTPQTCNCHCHTYGKNTDCLVLNCKAPYKCKHCCAPEIKKVTSDGIDPSHKITDQTGPESLHASAPSGENWEKIIENAITDGQNQIHDLRSRKATADEITRRMVESYQFYCEKMKSEIEKARKEERERMEKFYLDILYDVWCQYAYESTVNGKKVHFDGGLGTLEDIGRFLGDKKVFKADKYGNEILDP